MSSWKAKTKDHAHSVYRQLPSRVRKALFDCGQTDGLVIGIEVKRRGNPTVRDTPVTFNDVTPDKIGNYSALGGLGFVYQWWCHRLYWDELLAKRLKLIEQQCDRVVADACLMASTAFLNVDVCTDCLSNPVCPVFGSYRNHDWKIHLSVALPKYSEESPLANLYDNVVESLSSAGFVRYTTTDWYYGIKQDRPNKPDFSQLHTHDWTEQNESHLTFAVYPQLHWRLYCESATNHNWYDLTAIRSEYIEGKDTVGLNEKTEYGLVRNDLPPQKQLRMVRREFTAMLQRLVNEATVEGVEL